MIEKDNDRRRRKDDKRAVMELTDKLTVVLVSRLLIQIRILTPVFVLIHNLVNPG